MKLDMTEVKGVLVDFLKLLLYGFVAVVACRVVIFIGDLILN